MKAAQRVTLVDIAKAAGVSVATVDRVLNGRAAVSSKRAELVYGAARSLNYHGLPTLRSRIPVKQPVVRIGIALRRRHHAFYIAIESALRSAATMCSDAEVDLKIVYQSNNSPLEAASLIKKLSESCHAIALMAPDHSYVSDAVKVAREKNVFTFSLLSDFAIDARQAYLGLDNRKAGRTAAWGAVHTAQRPGALAIVVGNYSYLAQEMREAGFRSYIRERQPEFTVVDTLIAAESEDDVRHGVERLLTKQPEIVGIYVASGGVEGALEALRRKDRTGKVALRSGFYGANSGARSCRETFLCARALDLLKTPSACSPRRNRDVDHEEDHAICDLPKCSIPSSPPGRRTRAPGWGLQ